jgi:hypothetical protein
MNELITRLREAEGRDLELEAEIWEHFGYRIKKLNVGTRPGAYLAYPTDGRPERCQPAKLAIMSSLDAALALVAEVLKDQSPSVNLNINSVNNHATIAAFTETNWRKSDHNGWHKSPAIALLIALLQAQGVQDG